MVRRALRRLSTVTFLGRVSGMSPSRAFSAYRLHTGNGVFAFSIHGIFVSVLVGRRAVSALSRSISCVSVRLVRYHMGHVVPRFRGSGVRAPGSGLRALVRDRGRRRARGRRSEVRSNDKPPARYAAG